MEEGFCRNVMKRWILTDMLHVVGQYPEIVSDKSIAYTIITNKISFIDFEVQIVNHEIEIWRLFIYLHWKFNRTVVSVNTCWASFFLHFIATQLPISFISKSPGDNWVRKESRGKSIYSGNFRTHPIADQNLDLFNVMLILVNDCKISYHQHIDLM